jgi:DNA-binding NtrC family response regulator
VVEQTLQSWHYQVACATDAEQLLLLISKEQVAVLLLDLQFGKSDGLQVLERVLDLQADLPVVMLTGHGSINTAVMAIKAGAYDYLTKPPDWEGMRVVLSHATEKRSLSDRLHNLEQIIDQASPMRMWGQSAEMLQIQALIDTVAPTDATALIFGESGTGKELVARALHDRSGRSSGPFVPVNMAALPRELIESTLFGHEKGAFTGAVQPQIGCCEAADKGTLFLDEIGEMDMQLQAKLLRFLQERVIQRVGSTKTKRVNVRVVAATNRDLLDQTRKGQFREDLYYRLHVVPFHLPPLRQRQEDLPLLASRFLQRFAGKYRKELRGFTPAAMDLLERFHWPGNIRQLENVVERVAILSLGPLIDVDLLPPEVFSSQTPDRNKSFQTNQDELETVGKSTLLPIAELEKKAICEALQKTGGNVRGAAEVLGLGPATVYRKIKRYSISVNQISPPSTPCYPS